MGYAYGLRGVSVGNQTVYVTPVAPTKTIVGITDAMLNLIPTVWVNDTLGHMYPGADRALAAIRGEGQIVQNASYEHLAYLAHPIFGPVSAVGSDPYVRTYSAPTIAVAKPQVYTIDYGVSGAGYRFQGAFGTRLNIKGSTEGVWVATLDLVGRHIISETPVASAEDVVELINVADTAVYIDAWGGTMGTTLISDELIDFDFTVETNNHLKTFMGNIYPSNYGGNRWTGTLTLTMEVDTNSLALINAMAAATPAMVQRQIELRATKSGSPNRSAKIQFAGTLTEPVKLYDEREGNMTVALTFTGTYNTTFANWLKLILESNLSDTGGTYEFWS